jgi:hypothetical protein
MVVWKEAATAGHEEEPASAAAAEDGAAAVPARLMDCVTLRRLQFEREHREAEAAASVLSLEQRLALVPAGVPHRFRERARLLEQLQEARKHLADIASGEALRRFEAKIAPYVEEYDKLGGLAADKVSSGKRKREDGGVSSGVVEVLGGAGSKRARLAANASLAASRKYDRSSLHHEFATHVLHAPAPIIVENRDSCDRCDVPMLVLATEALLVCPKCSRARLYAQTTSQQIAYGEEVREFTSFSYKRHNHFKDWLNAFQAKESAEVPMEVLERVMAELHSRRMTVAQITARRVREVLKELKLRKFYDHTAQITARITGRPPPRMTPQQEEQCRLMFHAVEASFEVHCPPDRRNFLSYSYCLHKFVELLGWTEFTACFALLKGRDKLQKQDAIFQLICADLQWEFIPSV